MVVAGDHWPPRADIVDVTLAFDIPQIRAIGAIGEERLAADRLERAHRRIDSAGHQLARALEQIVIAGHGLVFYLVNKFA
jgi:hypothetical protein